jgi:tetratricopeptide (TPR) repeat protein
LTTVEKRPIDRLYWTGALLVWLGSFIVYWLTVQRSIPFWDCGEFIAASAILGVPHPPGTPLFIMIGRLFAVLPIADDISFRINMISVISSAFTAMLAYMVTARMIRYFFTDPQDFRNRLITVAGAVAGGFFVAFGATNWNNSIEAEVYGIAMALSMLIVLLSLKYYDERGGGNSIKYMVLALYLAMLGVGIHMTVFLVVPTCALVFMLNNDATRRDWLVVCLFVIIELALIFLFSNNRGGVSMFYLLTAVFGLIVLILTYKRINWGRAIAIVAISSVMIGFSEFLTVCLPIGTGLLLLLGFLAKTRGWRVDWRAGLAIVAVAVVGFSVHLYMPVRSSLHPRIDENMTSRGYKQFVYALDRKQYGQMSMVDRMFKRRGEWSNQLGRHAHMGFWSYFEEQFSGSGWRFVPFLALGLIGLATAIRKRLEMGLPFLTLLLLTSVGLVLYMNFADGTKYDFETGDAYLEVRDRDYFFTPAFVVFGIAMGLGVAGVINWLKSLFGRNDATQARVAYAGVVLALLPSFTLADNWRENNRNGNTIAYTYAKNILDSCDKDAILFTFGDNDTFPVWALQEAYGYRTDVRVVNMSLLNTDWYVEQMKFTYNVPMSLTREQIRHTVFMMQGEQEFSRPAERFFDRPRNRNTFMIPNPWEGKILTVANMIMEDIVLENRWRYPVFFTSPPYAESPLGLRARAVQIGIVYRLEREPTSSLIDVDKSDQLFLETYSYAGYLNSKVYRDENATGIFLGMGVASTRVVDELIQMGDRERAIRLTQHILSVYPEYWQAYLQMGELYSASGDTAKITPLYRTLFDTLSAFLNGNSHNAYYRQDLGMIGVEIGKRTKDSLLIERGASELWRAFDENPNNAYAFRKLVTSLGQLGRFADMQRAAERFSEYKVNLSDPVLNQILGRSPSSAPRSLEDM